LARGRSSTFTIPGGQWVSLLGASGAGKTSLLRIIAGLAKATAGEVRASDGQPIDKRLAWMGQKDLLYPWLSVRDNVSLGARLRGERVTIGGLPRCYSRLALNTAPATARPPSQAACASVRRWRVRSTKTGPSC
jgi:ABC-type sugar transport system ATPase subunit